MKNSKPVIAYIGIGWNIGGGNRIIFEHANRLAKRGYSVYLISVDLSFDTSWFSFHKNISFYDYNKPHLWINDVDIMFATYNETLWLIMDLPSRIKKGYFIQSDERHFYPEGSLEYYMAENTYRYKGLYCYTEAEWIKNWLKKDYDIEASVVKNKINEENFYPEKTSEFSSKRKVVIVEGNANVPKKGIEDGAKAIEGLDAEKWLLTSATGKLPEYTKVFDRIFQTPPQSDIRKIYSGADILIKPSYFEGSPLPHLESMCCGTAVVTTNCPGVDEYCVHMENSYIVDVGDIKAIRNATKELLSNDDLRNRLVSNGLEFAKSYLYDWDEEIDKLEDFIDFICKNEQYLYYSEMQTRKLLESNYLSHRANRELKALDAVINRMNSIESLIQSFKKFLPIKLYKKIKK